MIFLPGDDVRYQHSALSHRVLPHSLRPQHSDVRSHVRYQNILQWIVTWLGASALSLLVLGVLLEMHC
jgi:hypothetical protein